MNSQTGSVVFHLNMIKVVSEGIQGDKAPRRLGFVTAFLEVTTRINYLHGLNGSCSSAQQPTGTSKKKVAKT